MDEVRDVGPEDLVARFQLDALGGLVRVLRNLVVIEADTRRLSVLGADDADLFGLGEVLQSAGRCNELQRGHRRCERILTWTRHETGDVHLAAVHLAHYHGRDRLGDEPARLADQPIAQLLRRQPRRLHIVEQRQ